MKHLPEEKILIIRLSSLGDILLATPLIRSIKKKMPSVKLDFLLREEYEDTLKFNPHLNCLIPFTNKKTDEIKELIAKEQYDVIIDLQNNMRSAGLLEKTRTRRIKYDKKNVAKFLLVYFKINLLKNSQPVPIRYSEDFPSVTLDDEGLQLFTNKTASDKLLPGTRYLGFAPGAKHFTKRWLPEFYIETGNKLSASGYTIVLFGGKDDKDICRFISGKISGSINLCNNNELLQTSADMKSCSLILCNDSGLMHTAAASGVPVIALFGSTVKEFGFTPYKIKSRIIEHLSLPCRPCTHIGRSSCPKGHFKCMKEITPDAVFDNITEFLNS